MSSAANATNRGSDLLDFSVLLIGESPSVHYAGWLLAGMGASVKRIGRVHGDANVVAFLEPGSVAVEDDSIAQTLVDGADIVIGDSSAEWERLGRGASVLIEPWGEEGAHDGLPESEILLASLGGATDFTTGPGGVPVYGFGRRYLYIAGIYAAIAALAQARNGSAPDQMHPHYRVSQLETVASVLPYATAQFAYNGSSETNEQSGPRFTCSCTDGFVVIYSGGAWAPQARMIGEESLVTDARFVSTTARFANADVLGNIFVDWCANRTVAQVMALAAEHSVAVAPVSELSDALSDNQLNHLDTWAEAEVDGAAGKVPRLPYIVQGFAGSDYVS